MSKSITTVRGTSSTHHVSLEDLRRWKSFANWSDEQLYNVRAFHTFHTPRYGGCPGGVAMIFITNTDHVFGFGHNCSQVNIFGFHSSTKYYRRGVIERPTLIRELSSRKIKELSVGGIVAAALSDAGTLLWWGCCGDEPRGQIVTPHVPITARGRQFIQVSCGFRIVAALSNTYSVFVWGQLFDKHSRFFDGQRLLVYSSVVSISCGLYHLAMLDHVGYVYTWGCNEKGQRGLSKYLPEDRFVVRRLMIDSLCVCIRSAPYATFYVTKPTGELRAVGAWFDENSHVSVPKKFKLPEPVSKLTILRRPGNVTTTVAVTEERNIYTWDDSQLPQITRSFSLIEIFAYCNASPGLMFLYYSSTPVRIQSASALKERNDSVTVSDIIYFLYLQDRPDLQHSATDFLKTLHNPRHFLRCVNRVATKESGKDLVLGKFLRDLLLRPQEPPT